MCSSSVSLFVLSAITVLAYAGTTCNLNTSPATWARVIAKNVFFNSWEPTDFYDLPGFCVNNDFFIHSLNYSAHVNLVNASAQVQHDVALNTNFNSSLINCGQQFSQVQWCQSHCQSKDLQNLIVSSAVVNGSLPLSIAKQIYETLGSTNDTAIAAVQVDLSEQDVRIDYDYYDDMNFCSVFVKVKKSVGFPYATLITVQKILSV